MFAKGRLDLFSEAMIKSKSVNRSAGFLLARRVFAFAERNHKFVSHENFEKTESFFLRTFK